MYYSWTNSVKRESFLTGVLSEWLGEKPRDRHNNQVFAMIEIFYYSLNDSL